MRVRCRCGGVLVPAKTASNDLVYLLSLSWTRKLRRMRLREHRVDAWRLPCVAS